MLCGYFYIFVSPGNTTNNASLAWGFFDSVFTNADQTSTVACCLLDNSVTSVTCGKGVSCAGQCWALEASLCPSGNCTADPMTCDLEIQNPGEGETGTGSIGVPVTGVSGSSLEWCTDVEHRCRVRNYPECCFYPYCLNEEKWPGRKDACAWLNYLH